MQTDPPNTFEYVDTQSDLDALVPKMQAVDRIAVDTEADSLHHYFEKVCLIQMSFGDHNVILDPLAPLEFGPFFACLSEKNLIFHGAEYDLRMLSASHQFRPQSEVFDTMLAAQLVEGEARSLVALAERYVSVELTKQGQRSDWSRRPLTEKQLAYAANDTRYLESIADQQRAELDELGRLNWHLQSCARMVIATGREKPEPDPERVWRIKGLAGMERRELAFIREIWYWRDAEARLADVPPFKIMGNHLIIELALYASTRRGGSLSQGPRLPRNLVGRRQKDLVKAMARARAMKENEWPDYLRGSGYAPQEPGPELDQLRAACDQLAEKLGLQSSMVASRKQLEAITFAHATTRQQLQEIGGLMDWQVDLLEPIMNDLFSK